MFELLKIESWKLNRDQLIQKHKQIRQFMSLLFIPFGITFGVGYFTWIATTMIILPVAMLILSLLLFITITMFKVMESTMTVIICNKNH